MSDDRYEVRVLRPGATSDVLWHYRSASLVSVGEILDVSAWAVESPEAEFVRVTSVVPMQAGGEPAGVQPVFVATVWVK